MNTDCPWHKNHPYKSVFICVYMLSAGIVGLPNVGKSTLFQCGHAHAQGAGGELSVLHDRSERRRRDRARSASGKDSPRFRTRKKSRRRRSSLSISPDWSKARAPAKDSVISSSVTFAKSTRLCRSCVVLKIRTFIMSARRIDPIRDIEVINTELVLADLASLQKRRDRLQKQVRAGEKSGKHRKCDHRKTVAASRSREAGDHAPS